MENTSLAAISQYGNMKPYFKLTNPDIEWKDDPVSFNQTVVFPSKNREKRIIERHGNLWIRKIAVFIIIM